MADNRENPSNKIRRVSTSSRNGQNTPRTNASKVQRASSRGNSSGNRSSQSINTNIRRSSDSKNSQNRPNNRRNPSGQSRNIKKSSMSPNLGSSNRNNNSSDGNNYNNINKKQPKNNQRSGSSSRAARNAERKKKKRKKIKRIIAVILVILLAFPTISAISFIKKVADAYDPTIASGVFDNITHTNKKGITNILLLGSDAREGEEKSRTDTMMIFTIDTVHNSLKLTSLARDTYVNIPGHGNTKLTHAYYLGGVELLTKTIEENFGIDIHNYTLVNFESFMYIIDAIGGVTVNVKDSELDELNKFIPETYYWYKDKSQPMQLIDSPGEQLLNGYQALSFARIRKNDSAFERDRRQRDVIQAMFSGVKAMSKWQYPKLLNAVLPYIKTNMKTRQIVSLGMSVIRMGNLDIKQFEFPITDSPYSLEGKYLNAGWVIRFTDDSVKILQDFIFNDKEFVR